jgi:YidC/Oxa1 family membrane protein insertase
MAEKSNPSKELSMEARLGIAVVLMCAVLFVTPYFNRQASPPPKTAAKARVEEPKPVPPPPPAPVASPVAASAATLSASIAAEKELDLPPLETDLFRIEMTNRGALVKSWTLKKYRDSDGKPLELVSAAGVAKTGFPFSIQIADRPLEWAAVNNALFAVKEIDGGFEFEYSDGRTYAKKTIRLNPGSYLAEVRTEVRESGVPMKHRLAWRGGFGDSTVPNAPTTKRAVWFNITDNKLVEHGADHAKSGPQVNSGNFAFAGFEDQYFAIVDLPPKDGSVDLWVINDSIPGPDGKEEPVVGGAMGGAVVNDFTLFVGPKDYTLLSSLDRRLEGLIDFGFTSFIAKPLFLALKWVNNNWVRNWGWSIILVTVIINILLLPLKYSSLKSMRKMSLVAPEMQAINDRYKGLSLKDPKMQNKNQEVMELYKKHGINPAGGCLPLVLQMPFLFAFYAVLSVAIELRQANWLWIPDLSQPETLAIRVLPLVMIGTQFLLQRMTPMTGGDPTQQRMMMFMPLMFGFMFYGASSGLVLYWLTGNVVGIAQQWLFNKTMPAPAAAVPAAVPNKSTSPKKKVRK